MTSYLKTMIAIATSAAAATSAGRRMPQTVTIELSEWTVVPSAASLRAGATTFKIHNAGTIPHAFEVEGKGVEKGSHTLKPGENATLTVTLKAGKYELYCPVDHEAHKKMGMIAHIEVTGS